MVRWTPRNVNELMNSDGAAGPGDRPLAAPSQRLAFLLWRIGHAIGRSFEAALEEHSLHAAHFGVLNALDSYGPLHQQRLVALLGLDRQTVANVARDLERRGLVSRVRADHDRRALLLHPTQAGRGVLERADVAAVAEERALFNILSQAERRQLYRLLARLAADPTYGSMLGPDE